MTKKSGLLSIDTMRNIGRLGVVMHACNPSNQEAEAGDQLKYEAILGYIGSSRPSSTRMRHYLKK